MVCLRVFVFVRVKSIFVCKFIFPLESHVTHLRKLFESRFNLRAGSLLHTCIGLACQGAGFPLTCQSDTGTMSLRPKSAISPMLPANSVARLQLLLTAAIARVSWLLGACPDCILLFSVDCCHAAPSERFP